VYVRGKDKQTCRAADASGKTKAAKQNSETTNCSSSSMQQHHTFVIIIILFLPSFYICVLPSFIPFLYYLLFSNVPAFGPYCFLGERVLSDNPCISEISFASTYERSA